MKNLVIDNYVDYIGQLKWLLLVVVVGALMVYGFLMKKRAMRAFASPNLIGFLAPQSSWGRQYFKAVLKVVALILLGVESLLANTRFRRIP